MSAWAGEPSPLGKHAHNAAKTGAALRVVFAEKTRDLSVCAQVPLLLLLLEDPPSRLEFPDRRLKQSVHTQGIGRRTHSHLTVTVFQGVNKDVHLADRLWLGSRLVLGA